MKKSAFLYIVAAGMLWGTSVIFFNLLNPYGFSPVQMTAMRGTISAVSMLIYVLLSDRKLFKITLKQFIIYACSGLGIFGTATCYYASMKASSPSTAVILMYTAPVFVMAYSVTFLGEKLNLTKIISVIIMIIGCALVSGVVGGMSFSVAGILFGFASGILYSAYNIFTKIGTMQKNSNSVPATMYGFIVMSIAALISSNPPEIIDKATQNPLVCVPLIIGIGICTCVLPYFLYTMALKDIPAGTASALGIIEPMAATVFSVLIFGEKLSVASLCGIVLILISVFALNKSDS